MTKLQEYLYDQYNLVLIQSEIDDILTLARQEIELPSEEDLIEARRYDEPKTDYQTGYNLGWMTGGIWALNKVRNPYPKPI